MFPLRDNIPSRGIPVVNYLVMALCGGAFLLQLADGSDHRDQLVEAYGMVPARLLNPGEPILVKEMVVYRTPDGLMKGERERPMEAPALNPWLTLFTCMFLHGGWMHFIGNMWFLYIFGDNVEDRFGHAGYLLLYLGCGLFAGVAHLVTNAHSTMPTIGASGAIAGVMGAYLVLYPRAMVVTLIPIFFLQIVVLPAPLFLGIWFLLQLVQGAFTFTAVESGGVAWWAHIGGFAAGAGIAWFLEVTRQIRPPVEIIRPNTDRMRMYRYGRGT